MKVHPFLRMIFIALLGLCGVSMAHGAGGNGPTYLSQGWSDPQRQQFYTTSQGSQMMPLDWFLALERPDSEEPFASDGLARFGYLPNPKSATNPNGLPVGFTEDNNSGHWVGMTCAACHTSQIEYQGTTLQIDGGPTNADLFDFLAQLSLALQATLGNDAKFGRFADKVIVPAPDARKRQDLHNQLTRFSAYFSTFLAASTPISPWGPARADAFGMIFNRVSAIDLPDLPVWQWFHSLEENNQIPNAPVSYPFLWGTSREDKVQWNGVAPNTLKTERLLRNITEVLGVFARINLRKTNLLSPGYGSTVNTKNELFLEENLIHGLWSPQWSETGLPTIDAVKAAQGEKLYTDLHCVDCHARVDRKSTSPVKVKLVPLAGIGTDPQMAVNVACRTADTGILAGSRQPPIIGVGHKLKATDNVLYIAENAGIGVWEEQILSPGVPKAAANQHLPAAKAVPSQKARRLYREITATPEGCLEELKVYRARPLDGIWATGPYLHNGSVPNLYQLLLPSTQRDSKFHVGSRSFDPVHVGFDTAAGTFELDTSVPGNSNKGHEGPKYGTELTEEERQQLLEFLKTL